MQWCWGNRKGLFVIIFPFLINLDASYHVSINGIEWNSLSLTDLQVQSRCCSVHLDFIPVSLVWTGRWVQCLERFWMFFSSLVEEWLVSRSAAYTCIWSILCSHIISVQNHSWPTSHENPLRLTISKWKN